MLTQQELLLGELKGIMAIIGGLKEDRIKKVGREREREIEREFI